MTEETSHNWADTTKILGIAFTLFGLVYKYITESFKSRRDERETVIKIAVKEAMGEIRSEIERVGQESRENYKHVNKRIDDLIREVKK